MTLDPERLLWTPGKKLISIPSPEIVEYLPLLDEINAITLEYLRSSSGLIDNFFKETPWRAKDVFIYR